MTGSQRSKLGRDTWIVLDEYSAEGTVTSTSGLAGAAWRNWEMGAARGHSTARGPWLRASGKGVPVRIVWRSRNSKGFYGGTAPARRLRGPNNATFLSLQ